MSLSSNKQYI
ncbi:hypothetical protein A3Q56_04967 [Intoshia linei]|uniref:Uncharacterized protein n=1 Tax=Intoshia linei TaxID=1819745 RepID=A0A177B0X3_9BILA|nr:hypothetical protein A3Q56_04967 [Intoshia linei]